MVNSPLQPLFRPAQQEALQYRGGKTAISAVPGSGKTFTLAHLAAKLVSQLSRTALEKNREVLVVTFTNSAANSLRYRIARILEYERGLIPYVGYRVRTLHGLAHDIVRERPALSGLSEDFQIIDEQTSRAILRDIVEGHLNQYGDALLNSYLNPGIDPQQIRRIKRRHFPEMVLQLTERFIKHCKDHLITPGDLYASQLLPQLPLLHFAARILDDYQRTLTFRGAVDFDDLVRFALINLRDHADFRKRLQNRWLYVLEDEAQDSSALQEQMLRLLTANNCNWVRVGDPNQAINTTFTTANPRFLIDFAAEADMTIELEQSGRSGQPIIDLANTLIYWAVHEHPVEELRHAFEYRLMSPTLPGDPQPNPPTAKTRIHIDFEPGKLVTSEQELDLVVSSLRRWLPENPDQTVAVLVPANDHGYRLIEKLEQENIAHEELLRTSATTRETASALYLALQAISDTLNPRHLASIYRDVWWGFGLTRPEYIGIQDEHTLQQMIAGVCTALDRCRYVEEFLWPHDAEQDWLNQLTLLEQFPTLRDDLEAFRLLMRNWHSARILPIDQLLITVAQQIFTKAADLALSHKMAQVLRSAQRTNPEWQLEDHLLELNAIRSNQRRFIGFDDFTEGYEPRPGVVTISTIHSAKGLEWDRVYLLSINSYSFPSLEPGESYVSEKWFIRDNMNLEVELLAQADAIANDDLLLYQEGIPTLAARTDYAAERLRLLYVGITRARRELIILWNTGRGLTTNPHPPALSLRILHEYLSGTRIISKE